MTQNKWFEYIREPMQIHIAAPLCIGVVRDSKEMIGCAFTRIMIANDKDKLTWCNYKDDIYNIGEYLISKLMDRKFAESYYKKYREFYLEMKESCAELRTEELRNLSNEELLRKYTEFYEKVKRFHALSFDIDCIDIVLEEK